MISKLIRKDQNNIQLFGAGLGALVGMILLLSVGQFYFEMESVMDKNRDLIDPEFLVVNKKVSILETFNLKEATFSEEEIENIRKQDWADKVEGFISNQFALSAYTDSDRFPDFYTDLFFEAIPNEYLDIKDERWVWSKGQKSIPIILPQDYINLYNFGFAPSQGLPQISPNTISLVNFTISIYGKGKKAEYRGKIIGFSNRINSILVPWSFLKWANAEYGGRKENKIARLVVVTKDPTNPEIVSFLDQNNYETIREKLKSSRLNIILKFIISFLGSLGIFIIILAFMVFVLSFQIMIAKSTDKIRKLKWLGYHYREISWPFIRIFGITLILISVMSAISLYVLNWIFNSYLAEMGIGKSGIHPWVISGGAILILVMFLFNSFSIYRQTRNIE